MRRRFAEDLVEAMTKMGAPPGETVRLGLARVEDGGELVIPAEPITERRRNALRDAARDGGRGHVHLAAPESLDAEEARTALEALRATLDTRSSYAAIGEHAHRARIDETIAALPPTISVAELAWRMRPIVAAIGDAHAEVGAVGKSPSVFPRRFLPVRLAPLGSAPGSAIAAIRPDRLAPIDADHPIVSAIDGLPIERWLAASGSVVGPIAPQTLRRRACREAAWVEAWRPVVAPEAVGRAAARLTLTALDGGEPTDLEMPLAATPTPGGAWPHGPSRLIDGDIGYMRLTEMNADAVAEIAIRMAEFAKTRGLIVDVRGNGGGERGPMRALAARLLPREHAPVVINAARPLLVDGRVPGDVTTQMSRRGLWPEAHVGWTPAERAAIAEFRAKFHPERVLPDDRFGAWHYCVVSASPDAATYDKPVVVLMDSGCFSATDVFLAAMKELPGVTLVGQASGGGSGAKLPHRVGDHFVVMLSSIVSFQPDGSLFDGRGVSPHVAIAPDVASQLVGGVDASLAAALEVLRRDG